MSVFLKACILSDFKSFRGKVIIESFKPLTAVIGENGSGKSNFMDAISFVTGENNATVLRVKTLSDLIHRTSTSTRVTQRAYVTLVVTVENTDISFTRVVTFTGTEYKIDNETVTRALYIERLHAIGLNAKTRSFLVFQGASDSLAMKNPNEITLLLEEISRSIEFKAEYERLKDQQQKTEVDIMYMNETKKYLSAVKKQARLEKKEAETYKELERNYIQAKTELSLLQLLQIKNQVEEHLGRIKEKEQEVQQYEENKNQMESLLKELKHAAGTLLRRFTLVEQKTAEAEEILGMKKLSFAVIEEEVSVFQEKVNVRRTSAAKVLTAHERQKNIIRELLDELTQVQSLKDAFEASVPTVWRSQDSVELGDSQIEDYNRLKGRACTRSIQHVEYRDSLKRAQSSDQDSFDNENRKKTELEDLLNRKIIAKEETVAQLAVLENNLQQVKTQLLKEEEIRRNAKEEMNDYAQIQESLEKVSRELDDVHVDMNILSQTKKRAETVKLLQNKFPGIYGRLCQICSPSHARYRIAARRVMGRYYNAIIVDTLEVAKRCIAYLKEQRMSAETFLPLDNLEVPSLKERLRNINEERNVKLLYDILTFSPEQIAPAILFVMKNTLVCDTSEDARMVAYELGHLGRQDCVSLDGTFYRKDGTFSGGESELATNAKSWAQTELAELKLRQMDLLQRSRDVVKRSENLSGMDVVDTKIRSLVSKIKYIKSDLERKKEKIATLDKEIRHTTEELRVACDVLALIRVGMDARKQKMQDIEVQIKAIEDAVFSDFCRQIGVVNIRQFEGRELRDREEAARKRQEFENQRARIVNQLEYEHESQRDKHGSNESERIVEAQRLVEVAEEKLKAVCQKRDDARTDMINAERAVRDLQLQYEAGKEKMDEKNKDVETCRRHLNIINNKIKRVQANLTAISVAVNKLCDQWDNTLKNCQIEGIDLPKNAEGPTLSTESSENLSGNRLDSIDKVILSDLDFSGLVDSLGENPDEIALEDLMDKFAKEMAGAQNQMKSAKEPNFKASEKMILAMEQLSITNERFDEIRKAAETTKTQFSKVKMKRYDRFMQCLDHVNVEIDSIYKALVNDFSAQAILTPINSEEPYLDGTKLSCIAPGKRFHELNCLSGGEKALASLALMFAIHSFNSGPFVILDEVDAALDKTNTKHLLNYISSKSSKTQFIVISLKDDILHLADAVIAFAREGTDGRMESNVFTLSLADYLSSLP